ncbi:MAG TPA: RNA polymerase sigma factor [Polyangiaceae bacterium]|nr:RNA polymerase sigma factor [Polyangiaceae bacterium]
MRPQPKLETGGTIDLSQAPDDDEVVARVRAGDRLLFEVLMRRHNRKVFRAARAILRSDHEAEDVMQHAYVRAFEHLAEYQGRARFSVWLTRIAVYEALARLRRRKRVGPLEEANEEGNTMADQQATPEQKASDAELRLLTEAAIDELPEDFRIVFMLRAVEQMSVADVAECLGIPEDTVKTRYFRARQRLRNSLLARLDASTERTFEFYLDRCNRVVAGVFERLNVRA